MGNCIDPSFQKTLYHPQLGHLEKEYHQNYTIEYFKTTIKLTSRQKYQKWSSEVRKFKYNSQTKNFLYLPLKMSMQEKDIFQSENLIYVFYQPYNQTLEDLVLKYKDKQKFASQEMIWYLIYTLIKVGKYFQKINTKIGNINLSNIVITKNGDLKVICEKSTLEFISSVEQVKQRLSDKALLAPEEIQQFTKSNTILSEQVNAQLSQVFSIGILVLGVASLVQPHKLYHYQKQMPSLFTIDIQKVQNLLVNLRKSKRFSELLITTIRQMIEVKPSKRIKSSQLFKRLSEYEHEILSKKSIYNGDEIQKIKQSLNGSLVSRTLNNSMQTAGNKTLQNNTLSFKVSQISENGEQLQSLSDRPYQNQDYYNKNNAFTNIL